MGSSNMFMLVMATAVVMLGTTSLIGEAAETPAPASCAQDLTPCQEYLTNTAPPSASCCNAINQTVATQLPCLCNLFYTPGLLESVGGNTSSALRIATACGQVLDTNKCKALIGADSPTSTPATPATPGGDNADSGRLEWTGFSALLLFLVSAMFY